MAIWHSLPIQNLHSVLRLVEEREKHWVKHRDLDVQFDQNCEAIDGLSEVDELGIEIDFSTFAPGRIMRCWLRKGVGSTALGIR